MHKNHLSVAIVLDDKFPSASGVSRSIQTQIEELTQLGHHVTLIAPRTDLEAPEHATVVPVASFRFPGLPLHTRIIYASRRVARAISQEHHFDIIHSQTDTGALLLAAKIARVQHIPHIHTFHTNMAGSHTMPVPTFFASLGFRFCALLTARIHQRHLRSQHAAAPQLASESWIGWFDWHTQAIIAHGVDASTTPSHYMSAYIRAAACGVDLPGAIIPTGYNRTFEAYAQATQRQRQNDDGKIRFITISRLVKEKRLDVIIQAFQQAAIPQSELYIVGDGAESKRLAQLAQGSSNIIFTGHVGGRKAIVQLLRDADVFVLASYRFDNQPIVIPESLVVGVPILYCDDRLDVGLNHGNSLLVQPDTASLVAGMQRIAEPAYHQQLVDGAKSVLIELSPQATAAAYAQLYQQVIEQYTKDNSLAT